MSTFVNFARFAATKNNSRKLNLTRKACKISQEI